MKLSLLTVFMCLTFFAIAQKEILPPIYLGEPGSNEGTNLLNDNDGSIKFIYRKGDWDSKGGFSDEIYSISSFDEGRSWSEPKVLCNTGKGSQCFATISPVSGELIVFYRHSEKGVKGNYKYIRTDKGRTDCSYNKMVDSIHFAAIGYGHCLWIDLENGKKRVISGVHGSEGSGCYYSDDDGRTWSKSNKAMAPNLIPNIWHTGSVESAIVELNDGRLWMLMRTSNDRLWESHSSDQGETWSEAKPSRFKCGPNTWVTFKKLSSGELIVVWNNAMSMHPSVTQDIWNFTNRDVIHVAISSDDGKNWHGFRELYLDPLRNSPEFVNHPGDKGQNESKMAETKEGNILVACGQAPGHRAFLLLDTDWIYRKSAYDDFSEGLKYWSTHKLIQRSPVYSRWYHYRYNRKPGAELIPHPSKKDKEVLQIRRESDSTVYSQRDCAVWNFPAGRKGRFETSIYLNSKFRGGMIALTDRWYQPTDTQGEEWAMYNLSIPSNGKIGSGAILKKGQWHKLVFSWDLDKSEYCQLELNGKLVSDKLLLMNPCENGISYVRFKSTSVWPDHDGFLVEYVRAEVE